jgi:hypothetical protein
MVFLLWINCESVDSFLEPSIYHFEFPVPSFQFPVKRQ